MIRRGDLSNGAAIHRAAEKGISYNNLAQEPIERPSWTAQSQRLNKIIQAEILLAEGKAGEVIASFEKGSALVVPP